MSMFADADEQNGTDVRQTSVRMLGIDSTDSRGLVLFCGSPN